MEERLQKVLAHAGVASRRKAEEMIAEGRVTVNDEIVTEMGHRVDPARDRIFVDGKPVRAESKVYYALNKPRGVTTTVSDELGRKTVMDLCESIKERVYPVGRLDRESEGLLVLTNDGDLAYFLTHPSCGVTKTYRVTVEGRVEDETIKEMLEKGVRAGPVVFRVAEAKIVRRYRESTSLQITVAEGVNREIRRLFAAIGHEVKRLIRIRVGPLSIEKTPRGKVRPLTKKELGTLREGMRRAGVGGEEIEETPGRTSAKSGPRGRGNRKGRTVRHGPKDRRLGKPDPAGSRKKSTGGKGAGKGPGRGFSKGGAKNKVSGGGKPSSPQRSGSKPGGKPPRRKDGGSASGGAKHPLKG